MEEALPGEGRTGYTDLLGPGGAQAFRLFFWSGEQLCSGGRNVKTPAGLPHSLVLVLVLVPVPAPP